MNIVRKWLIITLGNRWSGVRVSCTSCFKVTDVVHGEWLALHLSCRRDEVVQAPAPSDTVRGDRSAPDHLGLTKRSSEQSERDTTPRTWA